MKPKYDMLWKGMIEEIMEDLLLFVEPEIGRDLDLGRSFEYLDKELAEIYPQPEQPANTKVVDKLVKIFLRDGEERFMLLHIEVQGKNQQDFARRMFEYYARLFSKYGRPVAAIAVLTGSRGAKMPTVFEDRCLWMRARYEYKNVCIADYGDEALKASTNPFAAVMLVAKEALLLPVNGAKEDFDEMLLEHKLSIVKLLKTKLAVFGKKKTDAILAFLYNYIAFKSSKTNHNFMENTDLILGKTNIMDIFDQILEIRHQEGVEEGIKEGLEKAVQALLLNTDFSGKKIAELIGVPMSVVRKVKKKLSEG